MKIFKIFRKKTKETPVLITHYYCDNCKADNAVHIKELNQKNLEINSRWLCTKCIMVNVKQGIIMEIL